MSKGGKDIHKKKEHPHIRPGAHRLSIGSSELELFSRMVAPYSGPHESMVRYPSIEIRHLLCFVVAAELGGFRRAAVWLGVKQSSISRRINELEWLLGAQLFIRKPSGALPSDLGECFHQHSRKVLQQLIDAMVEIGAKKPISQLQTANGTAELSDKAIEMDRCTTCYWARLSLKVNNDK